MKINITKRQFWNLMRGMYMADWMANAVCEQGMERDEGIEEARNYVFSFAHKMGYKDYVEYSEDLGKYYATFEMDDEPTTRKLIDRYDAESTWEELIGWLGERDFFRKYTVEEINAMSEEDRFMNRMDCYIYWEEEVEKYGIDRLMVGGNDHNEKH